MPAYRIQSHTRYKSAQMVTGYIREADKWTKSGAHASCVLILRDCGNVDLDLESRELPAGRTDLRGCRRSRSIS
jgi:hypothetical protein